MSILELIFQFCKDNSELCTDWIIAISMAWGAWMFTILGLVFLILYARKGKDETNKVHYSDKSVAHPNRVWVNASRIAKKYYAKHPERLYHKD